MARVTVSCNDVSTILKYAAKINTLTITTRVVDSTCLRFGHVTRFISLRMSPR